MKKQIFILTFLLCFTTIIATPVSKSELQNIVKNFTANYFPSGQKFTIGEITPLSLSGTTTMYAVNLDPEGWILVSAEDKVEPVLGFNFTGKFGSDYESPQVKSWMSRYHKSIQSVSKNESVERNPMWNGYFRRKSADLVTIEPMIKVTWDQDAPFNQFCPESPSGPGGHVYVGCVAVAMAQAMSVYQYPNQGKGTLSYTEDDFGRITLQFDQQPFNWPLMSATSGDQYNAWLLYSCAVSVNMNFGPHGSGSYLSKIPYALKTYFKYHSGAKMITRKGTVNDWVNTLVEELKTGRPIIYGGDASDGEMGHAFNIDGVIDSKYFHLNWGWTGYYNGYFAITDLTPGGFDFTKDQDAVINIRPIKYCPTDVILSENKIKEGMPVGSMVGKISVADEAVDNIYTFTLLGDSIDPENYLPADFYLSHDTIRTSKSFDLSEKSSCNVFVRVKDQFDHIIQKKFTIYIMAQSYTGINQGVAENIYVYPNPADGQFFIDFPASIKQEITIQLIDLSGRVVYSSIFGRENSQPISITWQHPGFYFLEVKTGSGEVFHQKIRIQ